MAATDPAAAVPHCDKKMKQTSNNGPYHILGKTKKIDE
jgi:hypothetical protein